MKKIAFILIVALGLGLVARSLMAPRNTGAFDLVGFGQLPILSNGRIKPLDTVARSSLLQLQRRQRVAGVHGDTLVTSPTEWLLDVVFRPEKADTYPTFYIDHPEVLLLIDRNEDSLRIQYRTFGEKLSSFASILPKVQRRFSFQEIWPHRERIQQQAQKAGETKAAARTPFQRALLQLSANLVLYQRLQHSFVPPGSNDFLAELMRFQDRLPAGVAAVRARAAGQPHDEAAMEALIDTAEKFRAMSISNFLVIPPADAATNPDGWQATGPALIETLQTMQVHPHALAYAGLANGWKQQRPEQFNKLIELYRNSIAKPLASQLSKASAEARFNAAEPFYTSIKLYVFAFFLGIFAWLVWPEVLGKSAFVLVALGWLLATGGLLTRMWLEWRPPVTNLYSSALFVGWGAVALCLVLEYFYKNAVATVAASVIGFGTLLIAHHLSLSGDTLEMMQAVLDHNIWLSTHVVVVTAGYSATFLAGFLAIIYIVRGLFTRSLDKATADSLTRMVYGIVCFATLFSFVGTVLGGIWGDQSWGRFWGWDPKENGALIIVVWNAIILHARWGGMVRQRGLMCLAVGGNIVTSWSWFGTNMLGVGLHSYGFTDSGFVALATFVVSQVVFIALGNVPLEKWRSFRPAMKTAPAEHVEALPTR